MTPENLKKMLLEISETKTEKQTMEIKSAAKGCPTKLYDTLSSFSNQDEGGTILFGIDESRNFEMTGVYDPQDLQKKVAEQCKQMEPPVRPLFTVLKEKEKIFVAAEIPGIDLADRPCFYKGKGRMRGSYIRVGDADEPMTEYEVYGYEAYRKKYQEDTRTVERADKQGMDEAAMEAWLLKLKSAKPNLSRLETNQIRELMSITRNGAYTLSSVLTFGLYPQAYFPQLCVTAVAVPGKEIGVLGREGERFIDNRRIEGTIPQMLEEGVAFVQKNMKIKTIIDPKTGMRNDRAEYPLTAVREALLNALVHRDYSIHTQGMPIQILMFSNRLEIKSPGGLYGRLGIRQLGKAQADTRNPVLVTMLETMGIVENRYSGIPTIRRELKENGLPEPEFEDERGTFVVRFRKKSLYERAVENGSGEIGEDKLEMVLEKSRETTDLLLYCSVPRTRKEIAAYLGLDSTTYAIKTYVLPLVEKGLIRMTIPEKPGSSRQLFITAGPPGASPAFR